MNIVELQTPNTPVGLDGLANLSHEHFWQELPTRAGAEYAGIAEANQVDVIGLTHALHSGGSYELRGRNITGSKLAEEWYARLGAQNSLYGAREDLTLAARTICTPEGSEQPFSVAELIQRLGEDDESIPDAQKVLAVQMLLDATRDPSPAIDPMADVEATNSIYNATVKTATSRIVSRLLGEAKELRSTGQRLSREEKDVLSTALKFNFESRFVELEGRTDAAIAQQFEKVFARLTTAREERLRAGREKITPTEKRYNGVQSPEDLRQHDLVRETVQQIDELAQVSEFIPNGAFAELYFNLLFRHSNLTDRDIKISMATARQDHPHDRLYREHPLGRLSHDATIQGHRPHETLFVQVKAGGTYSGDNYHPDILVIDPLVAERGQSISTREARQELTEGLKQLREAMFGYLGIGGQYSGGFDVLERHIENVKSQIARATAKTNETSTVVES